MVARFEKIEKVNVIDSIADQLTQEIMSGRWKPGMKLPSEAELIEAFGATKYAVRGALTKLNSLGIIETRQGAGSFVCSLDSVDCLSPLVPVVFMDQQRYEIVSEFRLAIEPETAKRAALRATEEQIRGLWKTFREMEACRGDMQKYAERDMSLHVQIAQASGNPMFEQSLNIIKMLYMADVELITDHGQLYVHRSIIEAIEAKDGERAFREMYKHIQVVADNAQKDSERKKKAES